MVLPVEQCDVRRAARQRLGGFQPAEAAPDDDHTRKPRLDAHTLAYGAAYPAQTKAAAASRTINRMSSHAQRMPRRACGSVVRPSSVAAAACT